MFRAAAGLAWMAMQVHPAAENYFICDIVDESGQTAASFQIHRHGGATPSDTIAQLRSELEASEARALRLLARESEGS